MIKKLRKKLMFLFLSTTMIAFTVAMLLMANNTISKVQELEIDYANNIADSIMEQVKNRHGIDETDLLVYASKFRCWVYISDGITKWHSPEQLATPLDTLMNQIAFETNTLSGEMGEEQITENYQSNMEYTRSIHSLIGQNKDSYYGVKSSFSENGMNTYELLVFCPQSSVWSIVKNHCSWYPILWLGIFMTMYFLSRFLIKKAILPIEDTMRSQKEFIASASHELKAPLSVIQVNAETMQFDKSNVLSVQKQKVILDECTRMTNLIKSMLALASSDAGSWKMNMREVDVDTLLIETWEIWGENARKKNVKLDLKFDELYPKIKCDKERMTQVLGILLDNAITYSAPGSSIEMGAKLEIKQLSFFVIDHGSGIPDNKKGRVFERFYSGDPSRTEKSHYGLGLSIAQEIVKLHQGNIMLKDTPGGGCTFEIQIPLEKTSN